MIGLRLTVPFACWRKAYARELVETEPVPSPAMCYGALLSLVGEWDRTRHVGCRIAAGLVVPLTTSTVLRTFWQIKTRKASQGSATNAGPDLQQLAVNADLVIFCDSGDEVGKPPPLELRLDTVMKRRASVDRLGGWSLGESSHLINDVWLLPDARPPAGSRVFLARDGGHLTLPVWVDHVGFKDTRYVVGDLLPVDGPPRSADLPTIAPPADAERP